MFDNVAPHGAEQQPAQVDEAQEPPPVRVCRTCSVQSQTVGDFCPHCGKSYLHARRMPSRRALTIAGVALLLVAGAVTGIAVKVSHDRSEERAAAVADKRDAEAAAAQKEAEAREH